MSEIVKRKSIDDIFQIKISLLEQIETFEKLDNSIEKMFNEIDGYRGYSLINNQVPYGPDGNIKYVDRICWKYLIRILELEKYMLCTDFEKMQKQIDDFNFPVFTVENAQGYIESLKEIIHENVRTMMRTVYDRITDGTYYTGSGYRVKKKRNNNGIDRHFIIHTCDYGRVFGYHYNRPTVTDDLEKLCYILDGKRLPEQTIINSMRRGCDNKLDVAENAYFKIKLCQNGNTHYWIEEKTCAKLNLYGSDPSRIGENIRIKVF